MTNFLAATVLIGSSLFARKTIRSGNTRRNPFLARFDTVAQCEAVRKTLVDPSELADHFMLLTSEMDREPWLGQFSLHPQRTGIAGMKMSPIIPLALAAVLFVSGVEATASATRTWPGPLPTPWSGPAFRQRCVIWHWSKNAKPINNTDWADEDMACGSLWRHEHHCAERPDQDGC
jgi:hypothetical protein